MRKNEASEVHGFFEQNTEALRLKARRMYKFLVLSFCCSMVILLSACTQNGIRNLESRGTNIICFGDSITFGYGVLRGEDYPTALSKMISIPVINAGIDGDTSTEALKRLKSDVLDKNPRLVIIEFGGNDFLRKVPKEVTVKNIMEMIGIIHENGSMAAVADISAGLFMREYRTMFRQLCKKEGVIFISSILSGIITNPSMKSDFLHPNSNGYKLIAQRIYRVILPYFKEKERRPFAISKK